MVDYYEAHDQETIEWLNKIWQQHRESGYVYHVCANGSRTWLTADFFNLHYDDEHDCEC